MPLFPKKKDKINKDEAIVDIKDSIKKMDVSIKKKEQSIVVLKQKAFAALAQKNESLAKIHLANKLKQEKDIEKLYNIQRKLTEQIDAIEIAETMQVAAKALTKAVGILNQYTSVIESLNVEDIIANSEESMAIIDDAATLIGDATPDVLVDEQLNQELDALQAEIALDMGNKLAATPGSDVDVPVTEGPDVVLTSNSDEVKRELEKLKKEFEM